MQNAHKFSVLRVCSTLNPKYSSCSDLELPLDFTPTPQDGEVEEFFTLPLPDICKIVAGGIDDYKDNCNLVVLDFLIRHGVLTPDVPGYLSVVKGLRGGECS